MVLTEEQRRDFRAQGFVKLPGIIPREKVLEAVRLINMSIGENGIDPARLPEYRSQSYCTDVQDHPSLGGLFNRTELRPVVEDLVGVDKFYPVSRAQIALRFPSEGPRENPRPHIDGMHTPTNGVPEGEINSFTGLVGVFLTDVVDDFAGNFTVWPGSHLLNEAYFRERGPQSLLEGMPKVDLPEPEQIKVQAGDAVFAHYLLSHAVAPNRAVFTRYGLFFRLWHVDHASHKWETLTNAWLEWPGVRSPLETQPDR